MLAIPSGLFFGAMQGAVSGSVAGSIVSGALYGVLFSGFVVWFSESRLKGSQPKDPVRRRQIYRCIFMGETLRDLSLAPAVLAYVHYLRSRQKNANVRRNVTLFTVVAVAALIAVGFKAHEHHWYAVGAISLLAVVLATIAATYPERYHRLLSNLEHAENEATPRWPETSGNRRGENDRRARDGSSGGHVAASRPKEQSCLRRLFQVEVI